MVRRFHRSIYDELDDLKASMDYLFQLAFEPVDDPMLPEGEQPGILCLYPHTLYTEVTEHDGEVMVTVNMVPGSEATKMSVDLVSPDSLKIICDREEETTGNDDRRSFSVHRIIPLPDMVTTSGARSTYKSGVLDIHLRRANPVKK
jgi:HSP20 family molecular chaperone IbpA